jgi:hypothetical protein
VDTITNKARRWPIDQNPNSIDLSPDGRAPLASCRGRHGSNYYLPGPEWGSVVLVDTRSGKLLDAIVGGDQTTGLTCPWTDAAGLLRLPVTWFDLRDPDYGTLASGQGGRVEAHYADLQK